MLVTDFINKWRNSINYLGLPSVGIHIGWDLIQTNAGVERFTCEEAWKKIYTFTPPWFKTPQTFQQLVDTKNADYSQIVKEETDNGKLEYYRKIGLTDTSFCAFSNQDGSFVLLGDGNHRFLDCAYLINVERRSFASEIEKTSLDIIYLNNFDQVIEPARIWPTWSGNALL